MVKLKVFSDYRNVLKIKKKKKIKSLNWNYLGLLVVIEVLLRMFFVNIVY